MRRAAAVLLLGLGALLTTPGAPGVPDVPGDPTPPVVTPVITGTLGAAGWYTSNVTVNWSVVDPESIILSTTGCDTRTLTADTPSTTLTCSAESDGGQTTVAKPFKLDKTAPTASAAPSRVADVNGWYNRELTVSFSGADAMSGLESCAAPATYGGPDSGSATVSGICRDRAGNSTTASFALKYDETAPAAVAPAPARAPDGNGWYNHAVTVSFTANDAVSGVGSCTQATYAGPDDPSVAVSGVCSDRAGNPSASSVFTLKYDETAPQAVATASRGADVNGWYNHPLAVSFSASDATSGLASCPAPTSYSGPDTGAGVVAGTCVDNAGNQRLATFSLKYDATAPQATATPSRAADANGWYNHPLSVSFSGSDAASGLASCAAAKSYAGPDDGAAAVTGTCRDNAGNERLASLALKYDATAPQASATPGRAADANGWYNHALAVTFAATDALSGVDSCDAAKTYSGPDTSSAAVSGSCRDRAGNSTPSSFALKYDATPPQATAAPSRQPNANGWYNAPLGVSFTGGDATSGLDSCDPPKSYSGPDSAAATVTGTCLDRAGNAGSTSLALKYDATAPAATATPSRQPNANGWFNAPLTVAFGATDAISTVDSCDLAKSYSGPDVASTTLAGACRDKAGNAASASYSLKYDATAPAASAAPSRQPNANGWYNAPLTVAFAATDLMSGLDSCPQPRSYAGPDDAAATVTGTCLDRAGNGSLASLGLKYDATAPLTTATPSRQPTANGWFNAPLTVAFAAIDATSTVDTCDAAKSYAGPDAASASVSGACRDKAGNAGSASYSLKYDATPPLTTATPSRQPNANGWYNAALTVSFAATDATSSVDSCDAAKSYAGPDTASAAVAGACRDKAGNAGSASLSLKYDATAPVPTATPSRQPNANGWFNAPLTVSFAATDATSTVDTCDAGKSYSGPDSASTAVTGTCLDKAGNVAAVSFPFKYDATAPAATATPSRQPNASGWYNAPLTVSFAATDTTSTVDTCDAAKSYSGPDAVSTAVSGSCRDKAGNAGSASLPLKYDATAPLTTATPSRQPNANGWYNAALTVSFAGSDATSSVDSCDAAKSYAGPDTATATVAGACRDRAGNPGSASLSLKYDSTAPQATATPSRQPNANGWFNAPLTVAFSGTDPTSGLDSCPQPQSYAGPDSATAIISGTCLDKAGNGALASLAVRYDATAPEAISTPSRHPNANGWYNAPLTVTFAASDAMSGSDTCTAPQTYSAPDSLSVSLSGTCLDRAGNRSAETTHTFKFDATAPEVTGAVAVRAPDHGAWYNRPVAFAVQGADVTAGIEGGCPTAVYAGPDGAEAAVTGTCVDRAGNVGSRAFPIRYDGTGPQVTAGPSREPDSHGWYNRPLTVGFSGADAVSGLDSCTGPEGYDGPDSSFAAVGGTCFDRAGNAGVASLPLQYDATAPTVTGASPARPPDANGWYNRPLAIGFHGRDDTSGIDSCTAADYAGPDAGSASVSGACRDRAANQSAPGSFTLRYDATAPSLSSVTVKAGNRRAVVSWVASPDTSIVEIVRSAGSRRITVYRGGGRSYTDTRVENGVRYRYTVAAYDDANNTSARTVVAVPTSPLVAPAEGARVTSPPRLAWRPVEGATYYNVQVWRKGKILSAWPSGTSIRLTRTWTFAGRRYRLTPGRYRWYVWPGFGARAAKRYGRLPGSSSFVVVKG